MLQRVLGLLLSVIALFHLGTVAAATSLETETPFVFSVDRESYYGGERIELTVDTTTAQKDIAGFCVSIAYDDTRLSFLRVEPSSQIKNKTLQTDGTNNPVCSTYVCNVDLGHAPALSGTILTYVFEVNEGAPAGETELEVVVDQVCNWQGEQLDSRCEGKAPLEVLPPKSDRAFLESLEPSSGKLSPSFSADIYHYTLDVPYRVSSVTFDAQAGENGTVSVSRKTLQKAGSTTSITITATSENQKQKTQYLVDVNRAEEPEEPEWEAYLAELIPSAGELRPAFSPDVTEYALDVGADVQSLTFQARAGEDGSVSVSREKLNRAGTSTEIKITAVSLDKKNRQVYTVTVNRALEESASAASSPCFLTALQPSEGTLEPPFSPDILEYTLPVDSDVQSVTFQANASEGATVSINRKTLYKAGSTTEIVVTVRSEDRKTTKQYTVSVVRAEEGGSASERAGAGGTGMAGGNSGSNVAAKSNDGESPQSGEEPYIPFKVGETEEAAESAAEAGVPLGQTEEGTRETVFRENNQFSAFVAGMVAAVICVALGMGLVFLYEKGKTKKL